MGDVLGCVPGAGGEALSFFHGGVSFFHGGGTARIKTATRVRGSVLYLDRRATDEALAGETRVGSERLTSDSKAADAL